jgi:FKBP-type peptidyl-prolyl cis-trans isomerase FklB
MKSSCILLASLLAAGLASSAAAQDKPPPAAPASPDAGRDMSAQASYAIGLNIGMQMRRDGVSIDPREIMHGMQDGVSGAKPAFTEDQMRAAMTQLQAGVQAKRQEAAAEAAKTNKTEGDAFLKANATKPGVVTLPSGLQYQIVKAGTGPTPKAKDTVVCNYRGTLVNGKEFDSSQSHGGPATFSVLGVIKGWTEALQLMPVGSKWRLFVPADLAYGDKGAGPDIGPGAALIFDVELVSVQAQD